MMPMIVSRTRLARKNQEKYDAWRGGGGGGGVGREDVYYYYYYLLPLGAEPFVFQFAIQKFKDQDI